MAEKEMSASVASARSLKRKRSLEDQASPTPTDPSRAAEQPLYHHHPPPNPNVPVSGNTPNARTAEAPELLESLLHAATRCDFIERLSAVVDYLLVRGQPLTAQLIVQTLHTVVAADSQLSADVLDVINQYWAELPSLNATPLISLLQQLVSTGLTSAETVIELADKTLLQESSIISNSQILATRSVRINTGLLYKQQKFNLLREENEGYAKLSHEFNVALSELPKSGLIETSDIAARSNELLTVVNALIGYFELDPNRVLDNILDICSQNLLSHSRFILHFLHHSPWAPPSLAVDRPFAELGDIQKRDRLDSIQNDFVRYYKGRIANQGGSKLTAELLGFKLRYFASSESPKDKHQTAPDSLIFLIALLIKSGFIKLADIYPYLHPNDEHIDQEYKQWKEEMEEKSFMAKSNALALAGALGDGENPDSQPAQAVESTESKALSNINEAPKSNDSNQKVALLHALLAVGHLPASLQLLSLHPQISAPNPVVADCIHRILHISIDKIYRPYSPSQRFKKNILHGLEAQRKRAAPNRSSTSNLEWLDDLERRSIRGYNPFPNQELGDRIIRFFLDDDFWTNDIPVCESIDDFYVIVGNLLRFSGPRLGRDVCLLVKVSRIGRGEILKSGTLPSLLKRWVDISRISLIPALSLVGANPSVVNEVYELIQNFPVSIRFALYGDWQTVAYKTNPELKLKGSETDKDTKNILRRISKQDVKRFGRALAKKSTSNPLILWAIAVNQIEYYDNFVEVVVDAARFCTNLGYDVLEFVILSSLSTPSKNRVKEDGTSIASWLTGLSSFCAKLFRRYSHMDVSIVATYVACQLKVSNIYDLIVLRDLITQMSGILVRENLSDHQLRSYAGGDVLKDQAMSILRDSGMVAGLKKSSLRLLKALTDAKLVGLLFVLIAQERGNSLFNLKLENLSNLKLLGNLFDECHDVLLQYHEFVVSNLDILSFEKLLPPIEKIVEDFGIEPSVAFYLWRPVLGHKVRQYDVDLSIQIQKQKLLQNLSTNERSDSSTETPGSQSDASELRDASKGEALMRDDSEPRLQNGATEFSGVSGPWHPALATFIEKSTRVMRKDVWDFISPQFYTTFWQLSLSDISVPMQAYTQEVSKLTSEIKKKDADRTDMSAQAIQRRRRERERLQSLVDQLNQEFKNQTVVYQATKNRLAKEKESWFDWTIFPSHPTAPPPRNRTVMAILQHCVVPRCLFGPNEAIFSAKFLREMHRLGTKNFSTLTLYDKIFVNVHETVIFTCTNHEAENYGRFLREVLQDLTRWYNDKSAYEKEAVSPSTPGFLKKWSANPSEAIYLQYEEYRTVLFKWHKNMTSAFNHCLDSRDYMHVRNALAVLEKIIVQYPLVDFQGKSLEEKIDVIAGKDETRGDLQIRAQGYLALLHKSSKSWVNQAKFSSKSAPSPAYSPNTKRDSTPLGSTGLPSTSLRTQSSLNPTATPFKPLEGNARVSEERGSAENEGSARRVNTPKRPDVSLSGDQQQSSATSSGHMDSKDSTSASFEDGKSSHPNRGPRDSTSYQSAVQREEFLRSPRSQLGSRSEENLGKRHIRLEASSPSGQRPNHTLDTSSSTVSQELGGLQDTTGLRSRIPPGQRNIVDTPQISSYRSTAPREQHQSQRPQQARPMTAGTMTSSIGLRGPPPTGPRASSILSAPSNTGGAGVRPPQLRQTGPSDPKRVTSNQDARPMPPVQKVELTGSTSVGVNPERRHSSSATERELRKSLDNQKSLPDPQPGSRSEIQVDDARRPSRLAAVSRDKSTETARPARTSVENTQSTSSIAKDSSPSVKHRSGHDREERRQPINGKRDGSENMEPSEGKDSRRSRLSALSNASERENTARSRGTGSVTSERAAPTVSESRSVASTSGYEMKETGPDEQKEGQQAEKRGSHREKSDSLQREQKEAMPRDQKFSSHREDDEGARRKDERETSIRRREDLREPRHDRVRDSHHDRGSSRQSPSRTGNERANEKRERERENERRTSNRRDVRETRDAENRTDKSARDSEHRRDERERSGRERETESRRGSRKHERDRPSDTQDLWTRSGNGDAQGGSESNKRRRVLR